MKLNYFLSLGVIIFLLGGMIPTHAQNAGIYSKGTWSYDVNQGFSAKFFSDKRDGDKYGNSVLTHADLWALYFPVNHFAVGLWYDHNRSRDKNTEYKSTNISSSNVGYLELMYGRSFGNFNLQAWGAAGIGQAKYKYEGYETTNTEKDKLFNWMIGLESPFKVASGCNGYVTPGISYESDKGKWDGGDDKYNYFDIYLNLMFFVPTHDYYCDIGQGCSAVSERYHQGYASLGVSTWIDLSFGNYKSHWEDETGNSTLQMDQSENDFCGSINGYYYVIDNLAVGAQLKLDTYKYKSNDDAVYKTDQSGTAFTFMPQVLYNLPLQGCLNNLFVDAGFGLGVDNSKSTSGSYTTDTKENITQFYAGAGYNYFFTNFLAFTPKIGFESQTNKTKNPDGPDIKDNKSGPTIEIGLNYFFGGKQAVRYH